MKIMQLLQRFVRAATLVLIASEGNAASVLLADNDSTVVVSTRSGTIEYWKRGIPKPLWSNSRVVSDVGLYGAMRREALLGLLPDNRIMVIDRASTSQVKILDRSGRIGNSISVKLKHSIVDNDFWAAGLSDDNSTIYVANTFGVWKLDYHAIANRKNGDNSDLEAEPVRIEDNFTMIPYEALLKGTPTSEPDVPSTLFQCGRYVLVGTVAGALYFVPTGNSSQEVVRRQVGKVTPEYPRDEPIFDGGCLAENLAYTIGISQRGQVILWDMKKHAIVDHVNYDDDRGHPGMAQRGEKGLKRGEFLSIGDFDIRYWNAEMSKLSLIWAIAIEGKGWSTDLGAACLPDQRECIVYDGKRLWQGSADGQKWSLYAGPLPDEEDHPEVGR